MARGDVHSRYVLAVAFSLHEIVPMFLSRVLVFDNSHLLEHS